MTGDDLNEKDTGGDGWGDDDDFEDWGSLEEGKVYIRGAIRISITNYDSTSSHIVRCNQYHFKVLQTM